MPPAGQIDFSNISDEQLAQMLRDYGVDVGPINVATRSTYERKLYNLKTGLASPPKAKYEPVDDDEEDTEVELRLPTTSTPSTTPGRGTPSNIPVPTQTRTQTRREVLETRREVLDQSYIPKVEGRPGLQYRRTTTEGLSTRPLAATPLSKKSHQPSETCSPRSESGGGIPAWVKLVVLAVVMLLGYLIYVNMEPQATSKIPSIPNKVEV